MSFLFEEACICINSKLEMAKEMPNVQLYARNNKQHVQAVCIAKHGVRQTPYHCMAACNDSALYAENEQCQSNSGRCYSGRRRCWVAARFQRKPLCYKSITGQTFLILCMEAAKILFGQYSPLNQLKVTTVQPSTRLLQVTAKFRCLILNSQSLLPVYCLSRGGQSESHSACLICKGCLYCNFGFWKASELFFLQIASEQHALLIDLLVLGQDKTLAACLTEWFGNTAIVKVGMGLAADLKRIAGALCCPQQTTHHESSKSHILLRLQANWQSIALALILT